MSDEDSLNLIVEDAAPTALPTVQPTTNTFRLFGAKTRHIKLETAQPVIQVKKPENQFDEESLRKQCLLVAVNADWVIQQSHQKTIEKRSELIHLTAPVKAIKKTRRGKRGLKAERERRLRNYRLKQKQQLKQMKQTKPYHRKPQQTGFRKPQQNYAPRPATFRNRS